MHSPTRGPHHLSILKVAPSPDAASTGVLQSLATAAAAPGVTTTLVTGRRRLTQTQQQGTQVQVVIMGSAASAQDIEDALQAAVRSSDFQTSLALQGGPATLSPLFMQGV